ncbi:multidrug transporter, partial [Xanthomonas vesicatoria]
KQLADNPLRIGLSMKVDVNLHDQQGSVLPTKLATGSVFSTEVYAQQLQAADADIHRIIQDNLPSQAASKAG